MFIAVKPVRNRYIAFIIHSDDAKVFTRHEMIDEIKKHCQMMYHTHCRTYGFFLTRFQKNKGILRCFHKEKDKAISLLTSIQKINKTSVNIETIAASGTIRSLIGKHLNGDTLQESR